MAIAFRAASSGRASGVSSLTISKPTGTADGDILLCLLKPTDQEYFDLPAITTLSGWTLIATHTDAEEGHRWSVYWKRASSEGESYTWQTDIACSQNGCILAYSGCVTSGDPVDVYSNTEYTTSDTTMRAAGVTTSVANAMLVFLGSPESSTKTGSWSTMTERVDYQGYFGRLLAADVAQETAGASGDKDCTLSASSSVKHAFLVALSPLEGTMHEMELAAICQVGSSLTRTTKAVRTATSVTNIHMLRKVAKASLPATSATAISLLRTTKALHTVTSTVACSLSRTARRSLSAVSTVTAILKRTTGKVAAAVSYVTIDMLNDVAAHVMTARDWLVHTAGWSKPELLEAVEFWGWLPRTASRSLVLSATSAPTSTVQRMTSKTISAVSAVAITLPKKVGNMLWAGASAATITLVKMPAKTLAVTTTTTSLLLRTSRKSFSLASQPSIAIRRGVTNRLMTTLYVQAFLTRRTRRTFSATSSIIATFTTWMIYRNRRQPWVEYASVVAPTTEAYIYAPIAEVIR